eukprot:CAMPEP_0170509170 /NCGR_PEP_ID=MMETSP0208-20121228/64633_1 /TAXON_ID=197538 /ORGANISM="Strombidium inclinatum, Strain S3" /LENGTH=72 /DNA_ID=CAMNT_0010792461 /DNA_START=727 /DNA_END=945 /DNA_ORIENTATION=-
MNKLESDKQQLISELNTEEQKQPQESFTAVGDEVEVKSEPASLGAVSSSEPGDVGAKAEAKQAKQPELAAPS